MTFSMAYTAPVWLFFATFFFYYAFSHWREGELQIRPFIVRTRPPSGKGAKAESALSDANQEFVNEFNAYLASVNKASRGRHRGAAIGYALSGIIALLSMWLLLVGK